MARLWEKQLVAFPLMVSFAVIMSAEFGQGPRQRALAEQDQPRQALLLGSADPTFGKSVQIRLSVNQWAAIWMAEAPRARRIAISWRRTTVRASKSVRSC